MSKLNKIMKSVSIFHGRKDGYEDSTEYLKTINFVVEEKYFWNSANFVVAAVCVHSIYYDPCVHIFGADTKILYMLHILMFEDIY